MTDPDHLVGFALAAVADGHDSEVVGDAAEISPERGRDTPVVGVADDVFDLAVLDHSAEFSAKLKLVATVVDRPGHVGLHEDAIFDTGDQFVDRGPTGLDVEVGHAVDGRPVP